MNMKNIKQLGGLTGVLLLLGILIAFNAVLRPMRLRMDVTEDNLYTLSDGTIQLLGDLDRDVTLKFYFSKSNDNVPAPLKTFANRVRDLLTEYESRSGGRLIIEEFDPKPDSDEEEWAQRYGLQSQTLDPFGRGGGVYFGLVAVSGNHEAVIPMLTQNAEPQLEYMITRMITEVTSKKNAKIGVMSPLKIMGQNGISYSDGRTENGKWAVITEIERQYEVEEVEMDVEGIPDDIDTLMVIHPAGISDKTLFAIDQFVLRGGHLLAFTDPLSLAAQAESGRPNPFQPNPNAIPLDSNLNKLINAWGLNMPTDKLVADESAATFLNGSQGQAERNAAWLSLRDVHSNPKDISTSSINNLMLPFAGGFEGTVSNGLERSDLLYTEDDGFFTDRYSAQSNQIITPASTTNVTLAVRLTGTFKTAFPNGKPGRAKDEDDAALKESLNPGVVILVGDTDMLSDRFSIQTMKLFGQSLRQPRNQNIIFAMNLAEQLCGNDVLIGLRSRNSFDRPFDRVIELEKQAAIKWQAEEKRLNEKLQAAKARVNSLQQARNDGQQLMLTAEQQEEIKKFREEQFQTQQALKEVRKNLRRDIERLGIRIKVFNIVLIPLIVAFFGIARGLWIKKNR